MSRLNRFEADIESVDPIYSIVGEIQAGRAEQEALTHDDFIHHHDISGDFRGFFVGPSGAGKTTLLRKLEGEGIQTFDVDVDGIKNDFSNFTGDNNERNENPRNIPFNVASGILGDSSLSASKTALIIETIKNGDRLSPALENAIRGSNISPNYQDNLVNFANNSSVEDDLSGITLAMAHDKKKWGPYYDQQEEYWMTRYSTIQNPRDIHASYIAAAGSACTLNPGVINSSRQFSTWIHLLIDEADQLDRAIDQMAGKPIDYKGLSPQEIFETRNQIYACLSQVQIPFSEYKDVKNSDEMKLLLADKLKEKERKPFYYSAKNA